MSEYRLIYQYWPQSVAKQTVETINQTQCALCCMLPHTIENKTISTISANICFWKNNSLEVKVTARYFVL